MKKLSLFVFILFCCVMQIPLFNAHATTDSNPLKLDYYNRYNLVALTSNKGVLTQEMFKGTDGKPLENTIFIIQNTFEISGVITIPRNCTLFFLGGSIKNGRIVGNNTEIKTICANVFEDVKLSGVWNNEIWKVEWFKTNNNTQLINMLINLKTAGDKSILFQKDKRYSFTQPIVLSGKEGILLDFNKCIIEDSIKEYYQASYNSFIYVSNSSSIRIRNLNYYAKEKNIDLGVGGYNPVVIRIGDSEYSVSNVEINNIKILGVNDPSKLSIIDIHGDTYNCLVEGVECNVDLSYGVNCEYGKYKNKIRYPYNITIKNVVGNNMKSCLGLLRVSCAHNILFENCYGHNVQCFIDIWSGDEGSDGIINNVSFVNCGCDFDEDKFVGLKEPIKIDNSRRIIKKNPEALMYPISLSFINCHVINKGCISSKYAMAIKDTQAPVSFSNCVIKGFKYAANIDYSRISSNPIIYDGFNNNISFNHSFIDGQISISRTHVSLIDCFLKSNGPDNYLIKATNATGLFVQMCTIDCSDRNACIYVGGSENNSCTIINNKFTGSSNAYDLNIPCVVNNNTYNCDLGKVSYVACKDDNKNSFLVNSFDGNNKWIDQERVAIGVRRSGSFSQKPSKEEVYVGFQFFNTDTHKTIVIGEDGKWYNPDGFEAFY